MDANALLSLLLWIGSITGTILMLLMLASIVFGADSDLDIETDSPDNLDGSHSFGILKSTLTFLSIASFTVRAVLLNSSFSWLAAIGFGLFFGVLAAVFVGYVFKFLLRFQETGNWSIQDAVAQRGKVYIPIPAKGTGKIIVPINGINREIEARSDNGEALSTDDDVLVLDVLENILVVTPYDPLHPLNNK